MDGNYPPPAGRTRIPPGPAESRSRAGRARGGPVVPDFSSIRNIINSISPLPVGEEKETREGDSWKGISGKSGLRVAPLGLLSPARGFRALPTPRPAFAARRSCFRLPTAQLGSGCCCSGPVLRNRERPALGSPSTAASTRTAPFRLHLALTRAGAASPISFNMC